MQRMDARCKQCGGAITSPQRRARFHEVARQLEAMHVTQPERSVVVFDIDETLLKQYCDSCGAFLEVPLPITPMVRSLHTLANKGLVVVLITARLSKAAKETVREIREVLGIGDHEYYRLFMQAVPHAAVADARHLPKLQARKVLTQRGYEIMANVGDQPTDMEGGFAAREFRV